MGECGCGSFYPSFKFKGPGKDTYVLQVYPSCDYCNTPAGVILYRMSPKEARQWDLDDVPEKEIPFVGMVIPVIDPEVFKELGLKLFPGDYSEATP